MREVTGEGYEIDVVRGRLGPETGEELVAFWSARGALSEAASRQRLAEVVCVLRDADGAVAGVNSVYSDRLDHVTGRRFWHYRSFLAPELTDAGPAMIDAAFATLDAEFAETGEGPVGLCVLVADRAEMQRRPEAVWPGTNFIYAGHLTDGRQVRLGYFEGATIGPGVGDG